jgi:hypothetical protein
VSDLNAIAESQNTTFRPGDILFLYTGYISALSFLSASSAASYAKLEKMPAIGVKSNEETLRWIWGNQFAAVAGDMPAFEALPFQSQTHWLHEWLLAGWGLPIGELFDLEELARECKKLGKWSFWFCSMPLKVCPMIARLAGRAMLIVRSGSWWGCKSAEWCRYFVRRLEESWGKELDSLRLETRT